MLSGIIKHRAEDFIVQEVSESEKIASLDRPTQWSPPENTKSLPYLLCELRKLNLSTLQAIRILGRGTGLGKKRIEYAGIKDKRALTSQFVTIWHPHDGRDPKQTQTLSLRPLNWQQHKLTPGDLKGNTFTLTIRDIPQDKKEIEREFEKFQKKVKKGIPNIFGEQRFGTPRKLNHVIGKHILHGDLKSAVMDFLTVSSEREIPKLQEARENLKKTSDFKAAIHEFPKEAYHEHSLIQHLHKYPEDYYGALYQLPRSLFYLFIHSIQSHLFNRSIEEHLKQHTLPKTLPLVGSETTSQDIDEIDKKILKEENLSPEMFLVKGFNPKAFAGDQRTTLFYPQNVKLVSIDSDEFHKEKNALTFSFFLEKGSYATVLLSELVE